MKSKQQKIVREALGWAAMLAGCAAYSCGAAVFLVPNGIVTGGITGLATFIYLLCDQFPVGLGSILLNIPVLVLGFVFVGKKISIQFIPTVFCLGVMTQLFSLVPPVTDDPLIATVSGGLLCGVGSGLFVRNGFGGGTELLGRVIAKGLRSQNVPACVGICDGSIVLLSSVLGCFERVFYGLASVWVTAMASAFVAFGLKRTKLCLVISDKGTEIAEALIAGSKNGITMLRGVGMYTNSEHQVLMSCMYSRQIVFLKKTIKSIDRNAFVVVAESSEVLGRGFREL